MFLLASRSGGEVTFPAIDGKVMNNLLNTWTSQSVNYTTIDHCKGLKLVVFRINFSYTQNSDVLERAHDIKCVSHLV